MVKVVLPELRVNIGTPVPCGRGECGDHTLPKIPTRGDGASVRFVENGDPRVDIKGVELQAVSLKDEK